MSYNTAEIAQLGERQTEDLKVPGSNPEGSHELWIIPGLGSHFSPSISIFLFRLSFTTILRTKNLPHHGN